jgi:hypothetical protein
MLFSFKSGIQAYTVHEKPSPAADRIDRAEELIFVRDGFSLAAFLLGPLWMLSKQMWLAFLGYLAASAVILLVVNGTGLDERWGLYGILALHMLIGFEADTLMRWTLGRKGWRLISSVSGASYEECERRFLDNWLKTIPVIAAGSFTKPGTPGGLSPDALGSNSPPPYRGDIIPPKRTGWRSGFSFTRRK